MATSGVLEFAPGEVSKPLRVPIIADDAFDTTLEFVMRLKDTEGADLGKYLHRCRVKIVDDDAFPTNKYQEQLLGARRVDETR